jgi:hypothetical protein
MKINKNLQIAAFIINLLIFIMEAYFFIVCIKDSGIGVMEFYTQDSNMLAMTVSFIFVLTYAIKWTKEREKARRNGSILNPQVLRIPGWLTALRFSATCCLTLTFAVVVAVLAPMVGGLKGYAFMLFNGNFICFHFLAPILSFVSFMFLENGQKLTNRSLWAGILPTALYAAVIMILNITRKITGPYPFLHIYEQSLPVTVFWFIAILGGDVVIAVIIRKIKR